MPEPNDSQEVGYGKPPRNTRFAKGQSGNPRGRPKGSKNLATILAKVGGERVRVKTDNGSRSITKLEAAVTQLNNQAASGDIRAIRELLYWTKSSQEIEQASGTLPVPHERDKAVMANILDRIRKANAPSDDDAVSTPEPPAPLEK